MRQSKGNGSAESDVVVKVVVQSLVRLS